VIRSTGYGVIAEKPRVGHLGHFSVHPVGKAMRWKGKKLLAPFYAVFTFFSEVIALSDELDSLHFRC